MSNPSFIQKNLSQGIRVKRLNDKGKLKEIRKLIRDCSHTQKYQSKNTGKFVDGDEASYLVYEIENILES